MSGIDIVVNSLISTRKNLEVQDARTSEHFSVGDKLEAQVIAKEGDSFLLQWAKGLFQAQSDLELTVGEKLFLLVTEQKDGCTFLKMQLPESYEEYQQGKKGKNGDQVQKDSGLANLSLIKPDAKNIKGGQYLQGRVQASTEDLLLVNTREGVLTVKSANPLAVGTELILLVLENPTDEGEAQIQLWPQSTEGTNKPEIAKMTQQTGTQTNNLSNLYNDKVEIINNRTGDLQTPNAQGSSPQALGNQIRDSQSTPITISQTANTQAQEPQAVNIQSINAENINTQMINPHSTLSLGNSIMAKLLLEGGGGLLPGSIVTVTVKDKAGQYYLIEIEGKEYFLESDTELLVGGKLQLMTKETVGNRISLQRPLPQQGRHDQPIEKIKPLAARYGFQGEKEISQLVEKLAQLPVEPQTAVRYLLDPHLATAVIIPAPQKELEETKIEVKKYKESCNGQKVWEVSLDLDFAQLGSMEIVLKLIDGKIYTRLWAKEPSTELLLRERQKELTALSTVIEIVAAQAGPLIPREPTENIDLKV